MRPQANWQYLLMNQIMRGTFFMHPRDAIGLGEHLQQILTPDAFIEAPEREPFAVSLAESTDIEAKNFNSEEESIYDNAAKDSVAVFKINGTMLKYGTWCAYGTQEVAAFIREAVHHKNIGAIVVEYDTGGGSVSAIAPLQQVRAEAKALGKPFIASVDMCCSAGLYAAADHDLIIANNNISAEIGSIGVMMSFWDVIPYYEEKGYKFHSIYADQSSEKNQPFELALKGDYAKIKKELLNPLAIQFQNHMKASRSGKLVESAEGILNGKVYFAQEALENGLIDEVGTHATAIERAQQLIESRNFLSQT